MRPRLIGNGTLAPRIPREFAALIAALQLKGGNVEALLELSEREWKSLLQFCEPAHLTLLLSQVETYAFPSWVRERLGKNRADALLRFENTRTTYQEIAAALNNSGIEYVVVKGFTQAPEFVEDAHLRLQSDIDLYCPKETISHARRVLESIGYKSDSSCANKVADHLPVMTRRGNWKRKGNFFDPEMPLGIELHFCLWNESVSLISLPEVDRFWDRRIVRKLDGMPFPALNTVDHLGYLALHILRGLFLRDWIVHHVHELATFLHRHANDDEFWREWKRTHSSSLRALQGIAFFHAMTWFCCDVHEEVRKTLQQLSPDIQEWLRRFTGSSLEGMFRKNMDSAWLHAALVQQSAKKQAIKQAFLPPQIPRMGAPSTRLKNRQQIRSRISNSYGMYIAYLTSRFAAHFSAILTTLYRGFCWWLSQRRLRKQFQAFPAASLF
jgi:hypothetical protein